MTAQMTTGLMLQDDSNATLEAKVRAAAAAYLEKHGVAPNCCHVHKSLSAKQCQVDGITVLPLCKPVHHLLVGMV